MILRRRLRRRLCRRLRCCLRRHRFDLGRLGLRRLGSNDQRLLRPHPSGDRFLHRRLCRLPCFNRGSGLLVGLHYIVHRLGRAGLGAL